MKLSLALFLLVALVVILLPQDSEALRRRPGARIMRGGRARTFRMRPRAGRRNQFARRGRTGDAADAPPPPPEGNEILSINSDDFVYFCLFGSISDFGRI